MMYENFINDVSTKVLRFMLSARSRNAQNSAATVTNSITFLSNIVWLSFSMIYIDLKRKGKKKD